MRGVASVSPRTRPGGVVLQELIRVGTDDSCVERGPDQLRTDQVDADLLSDVERQPVAIVGLPVEQNDRHLRLRGFMDGRDARHANAH